MDFSNGNIDTNNDSHVERGQQKEWHGDQRHHENVICILNTMYLCSYYEIVS